MDRGRLFFPTTFSPPLLRSALVVSSVVMCELSLSARAADDGVRFETRPYGYGAAILENRKSARAETQMQGINAPVLSSIAPEANRFSSAMAIPEPRSAIGHMLQSHEFRFGGSRSRALALKDAGTSNSVDLESVKLRISRNKVLIRAEFFFN